MSHTILKHGRCSFEVLADASYFHGLGKIWIDGTLVRSGRLPLRPYSQTFKDAREFSGLRLKKIENTKEELRLQLEVTLSELPIQAMRDHSFDPIHSVSDWDRKPTAGTSRLDLVIRSSHDRFNGTTFSGFSYHWEYSSQKFPIYWIMDMASWELDGDIVGAAAYSQSACSAPVAHFAEDTAWSTEGKLFFLVEAGNENPVMTHNLPRWASHGSFDFQYKGDHTLIGVFDHLELIRSVLLREPGKPELKTFDKHIFDETKKYATSPKKILLHSGKKSQVDQQNLWTWVFDEVDRRARAEVGLKEEPVVPHLSCNFWTNFTVDSYYKDLLPAAVNLGVKQIFVDNLKKSSYTEQAPLPGVFHWNMCCGHEYEISDRLGGTSRVKAFVEKCAKHGIQVMSWTNNDQALSSPINQKERAQAGEEPWYVLLEDSRQKHGGAYMGVMSTLDFSTPAALRYFIDSHIKIHKETGSHFFFDSGYNLGFMPVSFHNMRPRTMWRGMLQMLKETQDAGIHWFLEMFGPFGKTMHGHHAGYDMDNIFSCYKVGMGNGYSTVPTGQALKDINPTEADVLYYQLAHMAALGVPLFLDNVRVDLVWGEDYKRALADYHATLPWLFRRYLQADGQGVLWHDKDAKRATLFNFKKRACALPGTVLDLTTGQKLKPSKSYNLLPRHTYVITGTKLPITVQGKIFTKARLKNLSDHRLAS